MIARVSLLGVLLFSLMLPSSSLELGVAIAIDHLINRVFWARGGGGLGRLHQTEETQIFSSQKLILNFRYSNVDRPT